MAMKSGIISKFPAETHPVIGFGCAQQRIQLAEDPPLNKFLRKRYSLTASNSAVRLPHCPIPEYGMM